MSRPPRAEDLVVFLGPSLDAGEARRIVPCRVLPPARQGDLWRALALQPRAIALVDGVFEQQPSVWHREILAALDSGIAVFGASSMGALRAAELWREGMVGVGQIFRWYRDGVLVDDSEVALLHAGPEHRHHAFTVPLVNVRHNAERARAARLLSPAEARALVEAGESIFYQERTWPEVLARAARRWRRGTAGRFEAWARGGLEDLKSQDARACLRVAADFLRARAPERSAARMAPQPSHARRRRLLEATSAEAQTLVESRAVLTRLAPQADALAARGLSRALLAGWARELGLRPGPEQLAAAERDWLRALGVPPAGRARFLALNGLDEADAARLVEELALEQLLMRHSDRMLADGPSRLEAVASQARVSGAWAQAVRALAGRRRR